MKLPKWISREKERIEKEREQRLREKGFERLFNVPVGETKITVDLSVEPREVETRYGKRVVLRINVEGEPYDLMVNPASPLFRDIIDVLSSGQTTMTIVRSGRGRSTRYSIKEAQA